MSIEPTLTPRSCSAQKQTIQQEKSQEDDDCPICLMEMIERIETLCHHFFHEECIQEWQVLHNTCPVCRGALVKDQPLAANNVYELDLDIRYGDRYSDSMHAVGTRETCGETFHGCYMTQDCTGYL